MTNFDNTKKALIEYDANEAARDALWLAVKTNADVEAAEKADLDALLKVRAAFYQDTKDINSERTVMRSVGIKFMRHCAELVDAPTTRG